MSKWPINYFRFKSTWLVIRAAMLFSFLYVFSGHAAASTPNKELKKGESLPWIAGWTVDGQVINLNHLLRKGYGVNVLVVSASWCEACKVCFKKLMPMKASFKKKKIGLFAVDYMEDADTANKYLSKFGFSSETIIVDQFGTISASLGVLGRGKSGAEVASLPLSVFFDSETKVIDVVEGCPDFLLNKIIRP